MYVENDVLKNGSIIIFHENTNCISIEGTKIVHSVFCPLHL